VKSFWFAPETALSAFVLLVRTKTPQQLHSTLRNLASHGSCMKARLFLALTATILGNSACTNWNERITLPANLHPVWRAECVSCHPLYPPKLLTESDWKSIMARLDKHFGVNAGVDDKTREIITQTLLQEAASDSATSHHSDTLRITDTPWHMARHRGTKIPRWRKNGEGKPSNCNACHKNTDDQLW
jgi:hypothetical protein